MSFREEAHLFDCEGCPLAAVLTRPKSPRRTGVVIVVGGPQYRVGSHRQFALLARALAHEGYPVLRFDFRGMGDSDGAARDFREVSQDVAAAIECLQVQLPGVEQVALWGLCDGASAALLYLDHSADSRVGGLCLLNPWVRSEASLAKAQIKHYYLDRLRQKEFWRKLLRGQVALQAAAGLWGNLCAMGRSAPSAVGDRVKPFQSRMADAWRSYRGSILLLLSGKDYTAKEFLEFTGSDQEWTRLLDMENVQRRNLPDADHTFSSRQLRSQVESTTIGWLHSIDAR